MTSQGSHSMNSIPSPADNSHIIVSLAKLGFETLMSRSQAKSILLNLNTFTHITLDFTDVRLVGQGFIDEIFRVYQNAHPEISFDYINVNEDMMFMIERGLPRN